MNVLYTKANCPMCSILKTKLDQANIECSLFTDEAKMLEMGLDAMPLLEINGERMPYGAAIDYVNKKLKELEV